MLRRSCFSSAWITPTRVDESIAWAFLCCNDSNDSQGPVDIADVQLIGITPGLHHPHSNQLVHGDSKGVSNPLSPLPGCLLVGFPHSLSPSSIRKVTPPRGLWSFLDHMSVNASTHTGGPVRWAAPELLDAFSETQRKLIAAVKSDAYALPMVIIGLVVLCKYSRRALCLRSCTTTSCTPGTSPFLKAWTILSFSSWQGAGGHPNRFMPNHPD